MGKHNSELIWKGRLHLGDEPGVYGDAAYVGLCTEFPITLTKFQNQDGSNSPPDDIELVLDAEDVQVYDPYPGHKVTVVGYKKITSSNPPMWEEVELSVLTMKSDTISMIFLSF